MCRASSPGLTPAPSSTQGREPPRENPASLADQPEGDYSVVVRRVFSTDVLVVVHYPAIQKFNGLKLACYTPEAWALASGKEGRLDPHFYGHPSSPFARFVPSREGLFRALRAVGVREADAPVVVAEIADSVWTTCGRDLP